MKKEIKRREFLQLSVVGGALCLGGPGISAFAADPKGSKLISPGCRGTKVRVARIYMGTTHGLWPKPDLDFNEEIQFYESEFAKLKDELSDVEFVDELVTSPEQAAALEKKLTGVDGILAIHFNIGIRPVLEKILEFGFPTIVFAAPFSGHEWVGFGALREQPLGAKMECLLTTDYKQLAVAIRPFRAIHHLREAKILNLTTGSFTDYAQEIKNKFGTEIKKIDLERVLDAYNSINDSA